MKNLIRGFLTFHLRYDLRYLVDLPYKNRYCFLQMISMLIKVQENNILKTDFFQYQIFILRKWENICDEKMGLKYT